MADEPSSTTSPRVSLQPPSSPLLGSVPTKAGSSWERDEDVANCPLCGQEFNPAFRRKHHCRQCGRVVCDECSQTRSRLPGADAAKKERVCDLCKPLVTDIHATSFLEDSSERSEIVATLRLALSEADQDIRLLKQALLNLGTREAQASQDTPTSRMDFTAFQAERAGTWKKIVNEEQMTSTEIAKLEKKKAELLRNKEILAAKEEDLLATQKTLEEEHSEVVSILAERDKLWREKSVMSSKLAETRRHIMALEMQRKESADNRSNRQGLRQRANLSEPLARPQAVTIAVGRDDQSLSSRQPAPQRSCSVM
mmetsp:Transcript_57726/g.135000  ORF Transcript_57726/g.135000 Transcript_57726/m.135000 type:complete len:311 (-) Transcript_57726:11-943(-)